ncbi:MAG: bifunctional 5,10-methylenetetrahydrofolate dehydrogenase/5,10-methenyltetrahydrofolate cyclohydrolase [Candidatus Omnitrophica bacterium]|nr:bifunctional 5,10-methylenetetrahydrofolate dehydrogenase/5,10-methenyltetrahydrofolate cyclohydrolase [Candidatus Omnitrophota bacterium]MDD5081531.1 bifunctional 5,10-methylenetetrahydrofolate dehydrogenase/5,10-methenyltetrahydrofolate cyclohydrolase [Candidatus Omnitrophota bacterium]MDD5440960.1 bifunctional 5,10-methylenetetrahydrofolate dehydrogenase/5,10-methenyltetrahydrofolate cyclohydrolase [Candidatus Omnitrophota bacterium]
MGTVLETSGLYEAVYDQIKRSVDSCGSVTLASVIFGNDYSSSVYFTQQQKRADQLGINYLPVRLVEEISFDEFQNKIYQLNDDPSVDGIIINKPFVQGWSEEQAFSLIDPNKDVEGMTPYNLGMLFMGSPKFVSPTVLSALTLLKSVPDIDVYGKRAVIVGASVLIGKPLAVLLTDMFLTVSIAHIATYEKGMLAEYVSGSDIVISAVGKPGIIKGEWIKEGSVVIDVGVGCKDGRICGDVEFDTAKDRAAYITPVPGGVGKLTTLFLFKNLIEAKQDLK